VRHKYDPPGREQPDRLTVEQVGSATKTWLSTADLKSAKRQGRYKQERDNQRYHQRRNRQYRRFRTNTRLTRLNRLVAVISLLDDTRHTVYEDRALCHGHHNGIY
jgi:hypothetical protein